MRSEILSLLWKHKKSDPKLTSRLSSLSMPHANQFFPYNGLPAHCAFSLCPDFLFHLVWNVLSHHFLKPCPCDVETSFCLLIPGFLPSAFTHSYAPCPQYPLHSGLGTSPLSDAEIAPFIFVLVYTYIHTKARKVWLHLLTSHFSTTSDWISFWSDFWLYFKYTDLTIADRML